MKIVVRGTNWVGDAVMTIPALRALRGMFPGAQITLCARPWAREIFQDADFIDEFLDFEKKDSIIKQSGIWRENRFDLAVILTNSFQSALLAKLGRAKTRFGYATEKRSMLLTNPIRIPVWKHDRHEVFYYLNLISRIGRTFPGKAAAAEIEPSTELPVSFERRSSARNFLSENGIDISKPTVALGVGSTNSRAKRWGADNYAELNDRIQNELGGNVILIGTKDELDVSNDVVSRSKLKPVVLTGKTSLSAAIGILAEVDLLVSNDMGLSHIGPAVGTKTIVIFGPTNHTTTRPFPHIAEIIRRTDIECSPCMLRDCPIDHRCMTRISVADVFERVRNALSPG